MSAVLLKLTGGGTVRGIRSPDGTYMFGVYDFIEVVCHKTRKFANNTWSHLKAVDGKLECPKLPYKMDGNENYELGPTQKRRPTPVVTLLVLRILGNALGSKVNADTHRRFEDTFARFMIGDMSVIEEIRKKPFFAAPVPKAPVQEPIPLPSPEAAGAKRMRDRDEVLFDLELQERQTTVQERWMTLQERQMALREKTLALQKTL